jgi:hypothetical protein
VFSEFVTRANQSVEQLSGRTALLLSGFGVFLMGAGLFLFFIVPFIGLVVDAVWPVGVGYVGGMLTGAAGGVVLVIGLFMLSQVWRRRRETVVDLVSMFDPYPVRVAYGPATSHSLYFYRSEDLPPPMCSHKQQQPVYVA